MSSLEQEDDLLKKKFRYYSQGQTGISHAYQTAAISNPLTAPAGGVPLASSGGNTSILSQVVNYETGETKTSYNGVPAFRIDTYIANVSVPAGQIMANPIDTNAETGVLIGWTVAVNDPTMKITCYIYGDNGTKTTLWDDTIQAITFLGRGLTQGQAEAVAPGQYQYSLDMQGAKDDIWPWIQRYRSTYSLFALQNNLQYSDVAGTSDDIWLVCAYTPQVKEGYSRVYLAVTNTGANNRLILRLQMSRIKFQPTTTPVYTSASGDYARAEPDLSFSDTLV